MENRILICFGVTNKSANVHSTRSNGTGLVTSSSGRIKTNFFTPYIIQVELKGSINNNIIHLLNLYQDPTYMKYMFYFNSDLGEGEVLFVLPVKTLLSYKFNQRQFQVLIH